jgi:hypothetical protein
MRTSSSETTSRLSTELPLSNITAIRLESEWLPEWISAVGGCDDRLFGRSSASSPPFVGAYTLAKCAGSQVARAKLSTGPGLLNDLRQQGNV